MAHFDPATLSCWRGATGLVAALHKDDLICPKSNTAQLRRLAKMRQNDGPIDFDGLYAADYWDEHQKGLGLPTISERARMDLPERCLYWLNDLLQFRLPPARVLEIGSAHGAFVKLMVAAGYDAMGMEMNSTTIQQARDWFGITVLQGPLEKINQEIGQFDVVALFDVAEHLTDPVATLTQAVKHLKPGGILIIQTPLHTPDRGADWMHYNPPEHTFLYSEQAMQKLLGQVGLDHVEFRAPIFPLHQFVFASTSSMPQNTPVAISQSLEATPDGRLVQAMLDLRANNQKTQRLSWENPFARHGPRMVFRYGLSAIKQKLLRFIRPHK